MYIVVCRGVCIALRAVVQGSRLDIWLSDAHNIDEVNKHKALNLSVN